MGGDTSDDEGPDEDAQAEKLLQTLLRCGLHRAAELPHLAKVSFWEASDATNLAASFVLLCASHVDGGDAWPIVGSARSMAPDDPPVSLESHRVQERV